LIDRIPDPESARNRINAWQGRIEALAADTKSMSDQMQAVRVTVTDPDQMVEVTVDSSGNLVNLRMSEKIRKAAPGELADTIMATVRAAKAEVAERSVEIISSTLGTESPTARALTERVRQQLTPPEAEEEA
jgi:DNA-binding protein YbaB